MGQVLLPAALNALVALAVVTWRRPLPPSNRLRAAALLWGGWTLVTGLVFSFMSGTMHPYYTVALAPEIAALVGIGSTALGSPGVARRPRRGCAHGHGDRGVKLRAAGGLGRVVRVAPLGVVVGLAVPAVAGLLVGAGRLR